QPPDHAPRPRVSRHEGAARHASHHHQGRRPDRATGRGVARATNTNVTLRSRLKAGVSKGGSTRGVCGHPSRRSRASARDLLRVTVLFVAGLGITRKAGYAPPRGANPPYAGSIHREAVGETGAAGGLELVLAAAARAVRGVPRLHVAGVLEPGEVVVTDDRR